MPAFLSDEFDSAVSHQPVVCFPSHKYVGMPLRQAACDCTKQSMNSTKQTKTNRNTPRADKNEASNEFNKENRGLKSFQDE